MCAVRGKDGCVVHGFESLSEVVQGLQEAGCQDGMHRGSLIDGTVMDVVHGEGLKGSRSESASAFRDGE